jgi:glycosyltransferase involved in cell wall biosynthesis
MAGGSPYLELQAVEAWLGPRRVFENLSLQLLEGEHTLVLGPNGAGKSALIKLLSRELYPVVRPGSALRIFGSGPERGPLEARISALKLEDRIAILPPKPGIGEEYDRASILVHPSEFEGFGLSVAEAMAHGLPVIAFADCDGVNDLLEDNHSGLLLERSHEDQENVRNLGQAMLHLAQNADLRTRLGSQATAITKRFDRAAIHDIWAQLLHEVAASKGDPRHELE